MTTITAVLAAVDAADLLAELDRRGCRVLGGVPTEHLVAELGRRGRPALRDVPAEWLVAELRRRNRAAPEESGDASVAVGGLALDPLTCTATWRGQAVRLTMRETEVLYALALARGQGVRWLRADRLAARVWRVAGPAEMAALRVYVGYLRRKLPGLVVTGGPRGAARFRCYGLAEPDAEAA